MWLTLTLLLCLLHFLKFDPKENKANTIIPDVRNHFADDVPQSNYCEVLFGCYIDDHDEILTHINVARNLPKNKSTYIKIKIFPNPNNIMRVTTDIIYNQQSIQCNKYSQVRNYFLLDLPLCSDYWQTIFNDTFH